MKQITILTGAGISAESGIPTFRDTDGLWEQYKIEDVATPAGWKKDQELVLNFYNQRRKQLKEVEPNAAHYSLVDLESKYDVQIITQNIDDLHERAGSSNIIHLHGELTKSQSSLDPSLVYDMDGWELTTNDKCERGSQLRPHVVWFGEMVPMLDKAISIIKEADIIIVIGTSMQIYPAASLVLYATPEVPIYLIDPGEIRKVSYVNFNSIRDTAVNGVPPLVQQLLSYV
jgi:NAD-dependent deacetylase